MSETPFPPPLPPGGMRSGQAEDGRYGGTEPDWGIERWRVLVVHGVTTDDGMTCGGVKNGVQKIYSNKKK